jgi:hypothetical protein
MNSPNIPRLMGLQEAHPQHPPSGLGLRRPNLCQGAQLRRLPKQFERENDHHIEKVGACHKGTFTGPLDELDRSTACYSEPLLGAFTGGRLLWKLFQRQTLKVQLLRGQSCAQDQPAPD